jgi:hypothetical protein
MTKRNGTFTHYFGQPIGNCQDPDAPNDPSANRSGEGYKIAGQGTVSGGSKPTPQAAIMKQGSGKLVGTYPKNTQKIRG